jgi:hypothetical protein
VGEYRVRLLDVAGDSAGNRSGWQHVLPGMQAEAANVFASLIVAAQHTGGRCQAPVPDGMKERCVALA